MRYQTDDLRITAMEEVVAPADLIGELPLSPGASQLIFQFAKQIGDIIHGRDKRLLVVIGPCSIHDPQAAREYAERLREESQRHQKSLFIVSAGLF